MKFIRLPQVIERTALSRSTIYEMMQAGSFPRPAKIGVRSNGWLESEIQNWMEQRAAQREAAHA